MLSNLELKIFTTSLAKVLSFDFQIVLKFRLKILYNLIGVGGSVTEEVASHFAALPYSQCPLFNSASQT